MEVDRVTSQRLAKDGRENLPRLPAALRDRAQWVRYRLLQPDARGKRSKVPWHPVECRTASSTDKTTWAPFETAYRHLGRDETAGLGFVFTAEDDIVGIDLDGVIDEEDRLTPAAAAIVRQFGSYAERSLSGTGVHIYIRGRLPDGRGRKNAAGYEVYDRSRFFTCTGWQLEDTPCELREAQPELLDFLEAHFKGAAAAPAPPPERSPERPPGSTLRPDPEREYGRVALEAECRTLEGAAPGDRHNALVRSAFNLGQLVGGGVLMHAEVFGALRASAARVFPPEREREVERTIRDGMYAGAAKPRRPAPLAPVARGPRHAGQPSQGAGSAAAAGGEPPAAPAPSGRLPEEVPEVLVPGQHEDDEGEIWEVGTWSFADAVLSALPAGVIYRRGDAIGELVGPRGQKKFRLVSKHRMRALIDRYVRLMQWSTRGRDKHKRQEKRFTYCTADLAEVVLAAALQHEAVRVLEVFANHPFYLGPEFVRARPGWNEEFRAYYDEPAELEQLREDLTWKECKAVLEDLIIDFPFADDASRENYYALLITALIRAALDANTPLFMIQSSMERTGKSMLAEQVTGGVIMGRPTPCRQIGTTEEEREKRLAAVAQKGATLIHLDNLAGFLDSASLASLLTARVWAYRVLGVTDEQEVPNTLTVIASANNPKMTGELVKRSVPIVMAPATDKPEERTGFKHDPLDAYIREVRPLVLGALVSMVERWRAGDREPHPLQVGGFNRWSQVVGGILRDSSFGMFMTNAAHWRSQADPGGAELEALVEQWGSEGGRSLPAKSLMLMADSLEIFGGIGSRAKDVVGRATAFGMFLRGMIDRPVAGYRIRAQRNHGQNWYHLERLVDPEARSPEGPPPDPMYPQ